MNKGNPGERRHRLERLHGRIKIITSETGVANYGTEHGGECGSKKKSQRHAPRCDGDIAEQLPLGPQARQIGDDCDGRRHDIGREDSACA
jgi:hypothetical protein